MAVDGVFGAQTRQGVIAFQKSHKLPADGIVGAATWRALVRTLAAGTPGSDAVRAAQSKLNALGYATAVDGTFGPATRYDVLRFQQRHELFEDGVVGPETWQALLSATGRDVLVEGAGGTLRVVSGDDSNLVLQREQVRFDIGSRDYNGAALYEIGNTGPATQLTLAFPELTTDPAPQTTLTPTQSVFERLVISVDGREVAVRRQVIEQPVVAPDGERPQTLQRANWVFNVDFEKAQTRRIHVAWRASYVFSFIDIWTAYRIDKAPWRRPDTRVAVTAAFHQPATTYSVHAHVLAFGAEDSKPIPLKTSGNACFYEAKGETAAGWLSLQYAPTYPGCLEYLPSSYYVTVPGQPRPRVGPYDSPHVWLPAALWHGERVFVSLEDLATRLVGKAEQEQRLVQGPAKAGAVVFKAGGHSYRFKMGVTKMQVDDEAWRALPAAPFVLTCFHPHDGDNSAHYVPLEPLLKLWGGKMSVQPKQHYFELESPLFRPFDSDVAVVIPEPPVVMGRVAATQHTVEVREANGTYAPAPVGTVLHVGQLLRTGKRAKVDVKFKNGSLLRLGQLTEIHMVKATEISLLAGSGVFAALRAPRHEAFAKEESPRAAIGAPRQMSVVHETAPAKFVLEPRP